MNRASQPVSSLEQPIKEIIPLSHSWNDIKAAKPWYVFFGPPGVGKTTTLEAMAKVNKKFTVIKIANLLESKPRLNLYLSKAFQEKDHSFFFRFQMEVLPTRFWQAMQAPVYSLVDETIYNTVAYSRALLYLGWLKEYEYQTFYTNYLSYFRLLPTPTIIFSLNCNISKLLERIESRGRTDKIYYSHDYLQALNLAFSEVAVELSKDYKVISIDTSNRQVDEIVKLYGVSDSS